ncbi:hypothetical protein [Actinoplanes derwentensis]|uniref:hypothetical protein n=1 Tax=Actinoplanes derwentensis TaxID=113562 RepID=UPI000B87FAD4|nr:hypothetical protein [Actinoplanes derwentensis]GID86766.1 hypothetical protein Ade03nite_56900 [Actinoplanes derwentensis]
MTEPSKPSLPPWLPLAAATAVGVAGLAAAAAVACRRKVVEEPALPPSPPAPDRQRPLESLVGVLSAEKPAASRQRPPRVTSPLPPVNPRAQRNYVILLVIAAVVVWAWVVGYIVHASADPTYDPRPALTTDFDAGYLGDLRGIHVDR